MGGDGLLGADHPAHATNMGEVAEPGIHAVGAFSRGGHHGCHVADLSHGALSPDALYPYCCSDGTTLLVVP